MKIRNFKLSVNTDAVGIQILNDEIKNLLVFRLFESISYFFAKIRIKDFFRNLILTIKLAVIPKVKIETISASD